MVYQHFTGKMTSRDYLKYALFSLMEEKSILRITVTELCDRAMLNRTTFYINYESLDKFFSAVMQELLDGLMPYANNHGELAAALKSRELMLRQHIHWFQFVRDHYSEFRLLLGPNGLPHFRERLKETGISECMAFFSNSVPLKHETVPLDVLAAYVVNARLGLLDFYLSGGMKYSPEYMAELSMDLMTKGPYTLLGLYQEDPLSP